KNRLVEVIKGEKTSQLAFDTAWKIQEACCKTPVDSADRPGFIVNRFFVPWLNESLRIVEEGVADIATVEAATKKGFGVGMGPFELMNVTGVPITLHAATTLGQELGAFYAPSDFIRPIVANKQSWSLEGTPDAAKFDVVNERLWGVVWQVAVQLVCVENVCSLEDCDLGARVGLRWPKGPFEVMNERGTRHALHAVQAIAARWPDLQVPAILASKGEKNEPFAITLVASRVDDDGVGVITFKRPDAMNALDEAVVAQLGTAFDALASDPRVKGIVIEGQGKAFVAGADVKFFVEALKADDLPRIMRFSTSGQQILRRIDTCAKPVVCKLHGLSLGGGSELALACDWIVAAPRASLGFPETGIGIYPGLGGTQRTARRIGVPLTRWLLLTGDTVDAKTAQALGLVDDVVDPAILDAACRARALSGETRAERSPPTSVPTGFEALATAFTWTSSFDLLKGLGNGGATLDKSLKKVAFKAPVAVAVADELVKAAASTTLEQGLALESASLAKIFATKDAFEGLSTLGVRRPV
ncbi:MAG TPA: enoyl-CoA hydratase-related protein, partial [Myxococcota bacterium]